MHYARTTSDPVGSARHTAGRGDRRDRLGQRRLRRLRRRRPRPGHARFAITHTGAGLNELITRLRRAGWAKVTIERSDGALVEALLAASLTVVVISPNQLKYMRSCYGSAGTKDDRFDAYVLADTLRTDRARLRPLILGAGRASVAWLEVSELAAGPAGRSLAAKVVSRCRRCR
jgi:hypothetical protein